MNDNVIDLDEYRNAIRNKTELDNGTKRIEEFTLEELEDINKIYKKEISIIIKEIKALEIENERLRRYLKR